MAEAPVLDKYAAPFTERLAAHADRLGREALTAVASEVPELVGPGPLLPALLAQVLAANLENVRAAISCRATLREPFVPPSSIEYARLLAQRGAPVHRVLLGYQVVKRVITRELIEYAAAVVDDHDDLVRAVEEVLAYAIAYGDAACQAMIRAHAEAQTAWASGHGATLRRRLDAVLDGTVNEPGVAEQMLGYPVPGQHVAFIVWLEEDSGRHLDLTAVGSGLKALPGVKDALVVPRDERTLLCWLSASDGEGIDGWSKVLAQSNHTSRVAFGELGGGIDGFRLSHRQARIAGVVLALGRQQAGSAVRYRDVSSISFLVDQPLECRGWIEAVLGDLAGPGEERERLRHTLHVFLEEGENAIATGRRLFLHRNTVKYRIDRAKDMLPLPIEDRRLDIALALRYCEWVPIFDGK